MERPQGQRHGQWRFGDRSGLDISDIQKIEAAEGYHMLSQIPEAAEELAKISPENQNHPSVLFVACRVYSRLNRIPEAMAAVDLFLKAIPDHPFGYSFKSMLLIYQKHYQEAYELLEEAVRRFPYHGTFHYDLARAAGHCERWTEAREWIYRAICIQKHLKIGALQAEVLAPIHDEIRAMHPAN